MIGNNDKEHGPRLVSNPLMKIMISVQILGESRPLLIKCSAMRDKSDIAKLKIEIRIS